MKNFEENWRFPNIVACALRNIEEKQGPRLGWERYPRLLFTSSFNNVKNLFCHRRKLLSPFAANASFSSAASLLLSPFAASFPPPQVSVFTQFDYNIFEALMTPVPRATTLTLQYGMNLIS
ncbi:hypothetical protein P8452_70591 [Trifolium repens]|nr:hypothetical protein P8452_70591 [Trifolium repens]